MQTEHGFAEIEAMLKRLSGQNITIRQTAVNRARLSYRIPVDVELVEFDDNSLLFAYRLNLGAALIAKGIGAFLAGKFDNPKVHVDRENKTIRMFLDEFSEWRDLLVHHRLIAATIDNDALRLTFIAK